MVYFRPVASSWAPATSRALSIKINPGVRDPNFIKVGSLIVLPASVAPLRTSTKCTVRSGDTLWTIAQSQLGHATFWLCIARANPAIRDANLIHQGQMLLLPATCSR